MSVNRAIDPDSGVPDVIFSDLPEDTQRCVIIASEEKGISLGEAMKLILNEAAAEHDRETDL